MPGSELVQSVQRAVKLLQIVSSRPEGISLQELADESGLQKSTIHNLLRTLCTENLLIKDQYKRFRTGPAVYALANAEHNSSLMKRAASSLEELHKLLPGDTIIFSTWQNNMAQIKLRCSPDQPGIVQKHSLLSMPPYLTVTSLALHAVNQHLTAEIEKQFPFEEYGECFWQSLSGYHQALAQTLQQGYCCRQKKERFSVAFIMPDGFVLGFSVKGTLEREFPRRQLLAGRFCNEIWSH